MKKCRYSDFPLAILVNKTQSADSGRLLDLRTRTRNRTLDRPVIMSTTVSLLTLLKRSIVPLQARFLPRLFIFSANCHSNLSPSPKLTESLGRRKFVASGFRHDKYVKYWRNYEHIAGILADIRLETHCKLYENRS